jgi:hypothetical protein
VDDQSLPIQFSVTDVTFKLILHLCKERRSNFHRGLTEICIEKIKNFRALDKVFQEVMSFYILYFIFLIDRK